MPYTTDTVKFFNDLALNNNRSWFQDNKPRYVSHVKAPADVLAASLANRLEMETHKTWIPKVFRIYRDVRFAKDKTPYKTRQGVSLSIAGRSADAPIGLFAAIDGHHITIGGGAFIWEKQELKAYRAWLMMDNNAAELQKAVDALVSKGFIISDPALKRLPREFDRDFAYPDLACRKGLRLWRELPATPEYLGDAYIDTVYADFKKMMQFIHILQTIKAPFALPDGL